ncbi:MAG: hypothetical protein A3B47_04020 [Candidatus Levybacteria bacterium RIFCSPLOWO2_01_FULL_39_24]|nr:MAG: hypothetical protein A2800_04790 [Candidatus Levybacteria bacterium RIFCSPHIGHO2_01_FULL_40_16]OGH28447.1 MAG: hypothetical protein A3E12_00815 [Candidatus Levybacteria bacterium RIFCSPHIGHO2_12_FULL_39_9]OGH45840.1 MAG: hypothetical protein A3B47_04020 [Candidatus Levybacteria bacterium RIFCSPLOWO2_01_FULL_39_24]
MRKVWVLVFFLLIFLPNFNISFAKSDSAFAQTASSSSKPEINYELPYPGLLPDSPLYFLKAIRDKTVSFLISDFFKKAEFDLLQADKRLNAGIYLFKKGKTSLAISTVSKAENYFEEALNRMGEAKMQGRNIKEMEEKLRNALKKHQQELGYFVEKVNANLTVGFQKEQKRLEGFDRRLNQ